MIKAFKLTKNLFNFVLLPLIFVISIGLAILTDKVLLSFFIALAVAIAGVVALEILARKKYNKIGSLLTDNCDPEAYRDSLIEVLSKNTKNMEVRIDLSYAYYHCGEFQQMRSILENIDFREFKSKRKNLQTEAFRFQYYDMWFFYFLGINDLESAEKTLNDIDKLFMSSDELLKKLKAGDVSARHLVLESYKGEVPQIEEKFALIPLPDKIFYKVCHANSLGRYYFRNGMTDKAKECFEFVVQNGNKLDMVKEAELKLKELKKEN